MKDKTKQQTKQEITDKLIEDIKSTVNKDIPDYFRDGKLRFNSWIRNFHILLFSIGIFTLIGIILSLLFVKIFIFKLLIIFFAVFINVIIGIIWLCRLFLFGDFKRLKEFIIVSKGDYVKCIFFGLNKTLKHRIAIPDINGKEFSFNSLPYIIDINCVWMDEKHNPTLFYLIGIPNPIDFEMMKFFMVYFDRLGRGQASLNIKEKMDVRYSGETYKLLKNDKIMTEMHRDNSAELSKYFLYFVIFAGIVIFVILIIVLVMNKTPVVNVIQNTTQPKFAGG